MPNRAQRFRVMLYECGTLSIKITAQLNYMMLLFLFMCCVLSFCDSTGAKRPKIKVGLSSRSWSSCEWDNLSDLIICRAKENRAGAHLLYLGKAKFGNSMWSRSSNDQVLRFLYLVNICKRFAPCPITRWDLE